MKRLIIITGPTAVGKTDFCIDLAQKYKTEIVSIDSRQIYKGLIIGTAQPTKEQQDIVKHHLVNYVNVNRLYTVMDYITDAKKVVDELFKSKDTVIMTGGTGLYINAFVYGLDNIPKIDEKIRQNIRQEYKEQGLGYCIARLKEIDSECTNFLDINNPQRILRALEVATQTGYPLRHFYKEKSICSDYEISLIGIDMKREKLYERIDKRVELMIEDGLVDEVKNFEIYRQYNSLQTIGYKEIFEYLDNKCSLEEAIRNIQIHTRHYAKRQITWLKNKIPDLKWISKK